MIFLPRRASQRPMAKSCLTRTTSKLPALHPSAPARGNTGGKARTCAGNRAAVRRWSSGSGAGWRTWVSYSSWRSLLLLPFCPLAQFQLLKYQLLTEGHPQVLQQRPRLVVVPRRGHDGYVHAFQLIHLRVVDFREDQLVTQPQRVIATAVKRLG